MPWGSHGLVGVIRTEGYTRTLLILMRELLLPGLFQEHFSSPVAVSRKFNCGIKDSRSRLIKRAGSLISRCVFFHSAKRTPFSHLAKRTPFLPIWREKFRISTLWLFSVVHINASRRFPSVAKSRCSQLKAEFY